MSVSLEPKAAPVTVNLGNEPQPVGGEAPSFFEQSPGEQFVQKAAQQAVKNAAGQMALSAAENAKSMIFKGAGEVSVYIEKNHYSVHVLSFCGGCILMLVSFLGILNIFASLTGLLTYILHFYQVIFGLTICIIDGPTEKMPAWLQKNVPDYVPFLRTNLGRSFFYLFVACLEGSQDSWLHVIVGYYFAAISFMHVSLKLKSLTGSKAGPGEATSPQSSQIPPANQQP
eukprot:TRINITY_DN24993_c0_g1_i1.p1 TRINITY_DN24993_c0_g1~~TRINITY_DN24993_c0_g1_i1.p1  ORF type:complete len:228 (+),score=45.92 TRINITY_DN24993_c0_g1_i1:110-793(+)